MCICDTYLRKYTPKHIKPMININKITYGCETFISAILIQFALNKWWLTQLLKFEMLYINLASGRILKIFKKDDDKYKNQRFTKH